jgi:hypothetical protein
MKKTIVLFEKTAMRLRSQRPLYGQGVAGHPGLRVVDMKRRMRKK